MFPLDSQTGELLIKNHTESYMGNYLCEVKNDVGKEQCKYTLRAYNRKFKKCVILFYTISLKDHISKLQNDIDAVF